MKTQIQSGLITEFVRLITQGIEAWYAAGKIATAELDKDPDFADKVHELNPDISPECVLRFAQIGRGILHPRMLMAGGPGINKLRHLPLQLQEKYLSEPIPVLTKTGSGYESLMVDVRNMTREQANLAFGFDGIRSEAAQRSYLSSLTLKNTNGGDSLKPYKEPYRILRGGKVEFLADTSFTVQQLMEICQRAMA